MSPRTVSVQIPLSAAGQRIDRVLVDLAASLPLDEVEASPLHGMSRSHLKKLIEHGAVLRDGGPCRPATKVRGGELVTVEVPEPQTLEVAAEPMDLDILYEDSDLVVVNKRSGLVVHPGAGHPNGTLVNGLLAHCDDLSGIGGVLRPGIVHRLDMGTSGVMVAAKNDRAHEGLARQFAERRVSKQYVAFVLGVPSPARGTIETFYGRHPSDRKRFSSRVSSGKPALTTYALAAHYDYVSRVDVTLGTGRTHQIRVHFADRGYPVVGDPLYGGTQLTRIVDDGLRAAAQALDHQALHARLLGFEHPVSGEQLEVEAPLPADLTALAELIDS